MYTRISRTSTGIDGTAATAAAAAAAARGRAGAEAGLGLKGRPHPAGLVGSANQHQGPGSRSGRHAGGVTASVGSGGGGGRREDTPHHHASVDPRNRHKAESLLEKRNRGSDGGHSRTTRGEGGASAGRGAGRGAGATGAAGMGQGHARVSPETATARREAFLAAGRTPSGRRAALEPRAGAGGGGGGGEGAAFDQYRQQQRQQGQGFSGQGTLRSGRLWISLTGYVVLCSLSTPAKLERLIDLLVASAWVSILKKCVLQVLSMLCSLHCGVWHRIPVVFRCTQSPRAVSCSRACRRFKRSLRLPQLVPLSGTASHLPPHAPSLFALPCCRAIRPLGCG